jgi:predicted HicB family RNase H-like nuclease
MAKAVLIRDFPEKIHKEARLQAVTEGITLKDLIIKAVAEYVNRGPKKAAKKGGGK